MFTNPYTYWKSGRNNNVYYGGTFQYAKTTKSSNKYITSYNIDGSIDTSFNVGNLGGEIKSIHEYNGYYYVGGDFNNSNMIKFMTRISPNGWVDPVFSSNFVDTYFNLKNTDNFTTTGLLCVEWVSSLSRFFISLVGKDNRCFIISVDTNGNLINKFSTTDGRLYSISYDPSGILWCGCNGSYVKIIKLTSTLVRYTDYNGGGVIRNFLRGEIFSVLYTSYGGGKLYVGGSFKDYQDGVDTPRGLIRINLDNDANRDMTFGGKRLGFYSENLDNLKINTVCEITPGEDILVGGFWDSYQPTNSTAYGGKSSIIRLNNIGNIVYDFNEIVSPFLARGFEIKKIKKTSDGKFLVSGSIYLGEPNSRQYGYDTFFILNSDMSVYKTFYNNNGNGLFPNSAPTNTYEFYPPVPNTVNDMIYTVSGKIVVVGNFVENYIPNNCNSIYGTRYNLEKNLEFNIGFGFEPTPSLGGYFYNNCAVRKIKIDNNGDLLVGGKFSYFNRKSTPNKDFVKIKKNGTVDTNFPDGGTTGGYSVGGVMAIDIHTNGKILLGGDFNTYLGYNRQGFVRLETNGTVDQGFNTGDMFYYQNGSTIHRGTIYVIKTQSDGKILIGGQFQFHNGVYINNFIRLNENGTNDGTIPNASFNNIVRCVDIDRYGKILVGGDFTNYNGNSCNGIARLNANGTFDTTFNIGSAFNVSGSKVYSIKVQPDGKILVGGDFSEFNYSRRNNIVRLYDNGDIDNEFKFPYIADNWTLPYDIMGGIIRDIKYTATDKILIAGSFVYQQFNSNPLYKCIRLNLDGSIDRTFYNDESNVSKNLMGFDRDVLTIDTNESKMVKTLSVKSPYTPLVKWGFNRSIGGITNTTTTYYDELSSYGSYPITRTSKASRVNYSGVNCIKFPDPGIGSRSYLTIYNLFIFNNKITFIFNVATKEINGGLIRFYNGSNDVRIRIDGNRKIEVSDMRNGSYLSFARSNVSLVGTGIWEHVIVDIDRNRLTDPIMIKVNLTESTVNMNSPTPSSYEYGVGNLQVNYDDGYTTEEDKYITNLSIYNNYIR